MIMAIKKYLTLSIILIFGVIFFYGCSVEKAIPLSFTKEAYPNIDGSTVTIPLSEALAAKLMNMPIEEARQYVAHNKTHEAYVNLIEGNADLIFVTSPSSEELELAKSSQVKLDVIPIVSEAFVFLNGADNPVTKLTLDEIRKIYTGVITNWKEVGGADLPIKAFQRPVNSGSQTGFLDLVMDGLEPMEAPMGQTIAGMGELIDTVSTYTDEPDGIGYSYYYYTSAMWGNERVKLLQVDGVEPNNKTISSGEYPINTAYYAVLRSDETKDSDVRKIVSFLLSDEGQTLAQEAGYVKVKK